MVIKDFGIIDAIMVNDNMPKDSEEDIEIYQNPPDEFDLNDPAIRGFLERNVKYLYYQFKSSDPTILAELKALLDVCNPERINISSYRDNIVIPDEILDSIYNKSSIVSVYFGKNITFNHDYIIDKINKYQQKFHLSVGFFPSEEIKIKYLKLPPHLFKNLSLSNFDSPLYQAVYDSKRNPEIDIELYLKHKEFFDTLDSITITAGNVSNINQERIEILKQDHRIKGIILKSGYSPLIGKEISYTLTEYEAILKELNAVISKIKMPAKDDPNREKIIFSQLYEQLGRMIEYDHYAISEEGEKEPGLSRDCRSLKNGLLGVERNGQKKKTCVCAGYATILQNACSLLGIECTYIRSNSKEVVDPKHIIMGDHKRIYENGTDDPMGHAYNGVVLDGQAYLCDLTWDASSLRTNRTTSHFLKSYEEFAESHKRVGFKASDVDIGADLSITNQDGKPVFNMKTTDYPISLSQEEIFDLFAIPAKDEIEEMQNIGYLGGFVSEYVGFIKECRGQVVSRDFYTILSTVHQLENYILSSKFRDRPDNGFNKTSIKVQVDDKTKEIDFYDGAKATIKEAVESVEGRVNRGR